MSDSDITRKIETVLNTILSRKYNAKIKIKFVDSKENGNEQGRSNLRTSVNDTNAG